jgi:hydrogenase maturation protease
MPRTVVIGIGHPDRGDDAVGRLVAARLRACAPSGVTVLEEDGEATRLVDLLSGVAQAFLVDAALSGAPAGTIRRCDAADGLLPGGKPGMSTHGFGLAAAIELARALGTLPATCIVYAIEARSFDLGAPLSPEVLATADGVVERVLAELQEAPCTNAR